MRITTHGHCGIPGPDDQPGFIDNDRSLALIARTAVAQAEAGADIVAPSDRLDGRVQAIRAGLDSVEPYAAGWTRSGRRWKR